jgi:hypothetical protein
LSTSRFTRVSFAALVIGAAISGYWFATHVQQANGTRKARAVQALPEEPGSDLEAPPPATQSRLRPPPIASVPASTTTANAQAPNPHQPLSEAELMAQIRETKEQNPALALELARDGNRRFAGSADAPERASVIVHALSQLGRGSEARGEAEDMVNRYPDSHWVREVEGFSGAHRHRNIRINDAGLLEYY